MDIQKLATGFRYLKEHKTHLKAVVIALIMISLILFSSPAQAVVVSVDTDKSTYNSADNSVVFTVSVDIETNERLPIQNLTLSISGKVVKECVFYPNGTAISGCSNLVITPIGSTPVGWDYDWLTGEGWSLNGSNWGTYDTSFGYGYGYGYSDTITLELSYNITWDIETEGADDGSYSAYLEVNVENGGTSITYRNRYATKFGLQRTSGAGRGGGGAGGAAPITTEEIVEEEKAPTVPRLPRLPPLEREREGLPSVSPVAEEIKPPSPPVPLTSWGALAAMLAFVAFIVWRLTREERKKARKKRYGRRR